jgi:imidazolonepropionase-like amidohydrolase
MGPIIELTNGRFVDVVGGRYFEPGISVIIRDDTIQAMTGLPGEPMHVRTDFVLDLKGKAVIPGLFNTHCHIQLKYPTLLLTLGDARRTKKYATRQIEKSLADCLAHGVIHLRDALTTDLRPNRALRDRIAKGEIAGPHLHHSVLVSPVGGVHARQPSLSDRLPALLLGTQNLDLDLPESAIVAFPADASEQQVRDAVDRAIDERGAEYIKLYDQEELIPSYKPGAVMMNDAQLQDAADQARRRGVRSTLHHATVASFRRGVTAGVSTLAHLPCDGLLTADDVRACVDAGCVIEPTLTVAYYMAWNTRSMPWHDRPRAIQLSEFRERTFSKLVEEYWTPELAASAQAMVTKAARGRTKIMGVADMAGAFRYWGRMIESGVDNLHRLHEAGATIACGSDAGAVPAAEGMVQNEMALLDLFLNPKQGAAHLDGAALLRIATLNSAQALGLEAQLGSITTDKIADLVVLDGDPLADPQLIGSRAAAVFMNGQLVIDNMGIRQSLGL